MSDAQGAITIHDTVYGDYTSSVGIRTKWYVSVHGPMTYNLYTYHIKDTGIRCQTELEIA